MMNERPIGPGELWLVTPGLLERFYGSGFSAAMPMPQQAGPSEDYSCLADGTPCVPVMGANGPAYMLANGTAVLSVAGLLLRSLSMMDRMRAFAMGERSTGYDDFIDSLARATNDPRVSRTILDFDSGGGQASGVDDAIMAIRAAKAIKPVVSIAHDAAQSAAFLMAVQATSFVVTPAAMVGGNGVVITVADTSEAAKREGVRIRSIVSTGADAKAQGRPGEPQTDEFDAQMRALADSLAVWYAKRWAEARGMDEDEARKRMDGRTFVGAEAVSAGLVDGVMTFGELMDAAQA